MKSDRKTDGNFNERTDVEVGWNTKGHGGATGPVLFRVSLRTGNTSHRLRCPFRGSTTPRLVRSLKLPFRLPTPISFFACDSVYLNQNSD